LGKFGQVKRLDPLYRTVNFPRPMMAGLVSEGPHGLRADCVFDLKDDLAGLIWEAADGRPPVAEARDEPRFSRLRMFISLVPPGYDPAGGYAAGARRGARRSFEHDMRRVRIDAAHRRRASARTPAADGDRV